jgi:hypothetical protein
MLEKKDFVNLHIAVDEKSKKVVSFRITKGDVYDSKKFCSLVKKKLLKVIISTWFMRIRLTIIEDAYGLVDI